MNQLNDSDTSFDAEAFSEMFFLLLLIAILLWYLRDIFLPRQLRSNQVYKLTCWQTSPCVYARHNHSPFHPPRREKVGENDKPKNDWHSPHPQAEWIDQDVAQ